MPKPLAEELYHYTGIQGLKGIIESQTLWATHYKYLNDAEEIVHFQQRLPTILTPVFTKLLSDFDARGKNALIETYGTIETALEEEPRKLAEVMYHVTFEDRGDGPFAEPFIASFCTVDKDNQSVANHGLLSQWRGYGAQGGYAITFTTERLIELLQEEGKRWNYFFAFGGDIVYSSAKDEDVYDEFRKQIDEIQKGWEQAMRTRDPVALSNVASNFISCACRYKHWGFCEEQEFRFVCVPTPPKIIELGKQQGREDRPRKPVYNFLRNGTPVPYLNLFEGITGQSGKQIPIKRVIIGPHPDKERRKSAVEQLLRQNGIQADVSISAIPYLG
jgi:hypothetical protein